jgi:hypothetical protein
MRRPKSNLSDLKDQARDRLFHASRREVIVRGAAVVAAFASPMRSLADQTNPAGASTSLGNSRGASRMNTITTRD